LATQKESDKDIPLSRLGVLMQILLGVPAVVDIGGPSAQEVARQGKK